MNRGQEMEELINAPIPPEMHFRCKDGETKLGSIRCYPSLHLMNPFNATPDDIFIEDIAHHLALCNRYAGASPEPMTVAEHSVRVCRRVMANGSWASLSLSALLHDSEEAYFLDMPSPIKHSPNMGDYKVSSRALRAVIFHKYGLDPGLVDAIKWADEEEYYRERRDMWPKDAVNYRSPWGWREAESEFLLLFNALQDSRRD